VRPILAGRTVPILLVGPAATHEAFEFRAAKLTPLRGLEGSDPERTDTDPLEANDRVSDGFEEPADFAVPAFHQYEPVPGVLLAPIALDAAGLHEFSVDADLPMANTIDFGLGGHAANLYAVDPGNTVRGVRDSVGKFAVIGEKDETFALKIQAADGIDAFGYSLEEIGHERALLAVGKARKISAGLVQQDVPLFPRSGKGLPVYGDAVATRVGA